MNPRNSGDCTDLVIYKSRANRNPILLFLLFPLFLLRLDDRELLLLLFHEPPRNTRI